MKKLSNDGLPYLPTEEGKIEKITSDLSPFSPNNISDGPDNGFNDCTASLFGWFNRHKTTDTATRNLARASRNSDSWSLVNLCGHGYLGFLETGSGQKGQGDLKTNLVTNSNQMYWENEFNRLRVQKAPLLRIYSCHTGGGQAGADLLYALAIASQKQVKARTGFTYCHNSGRYIGLKFEEGSEWQIATPTNKPAPIEPPTPVLTSNSQTTKIEIFINRQAVSIPLTSVKSITVNSYKIVDGSMYTRTLPLNLIAPAMIAMFGSAPYSLPGSPAAMITAELNINIELAGQDVKLEYVIYNNRLLVNAVNKSAHYTHLNVSDYY